MENKPIKRSKDMVSLSREHHDSLLLCWKIKTGLAKNIAPHRIVAYTQYFYQNFLRSHFDAEEMYVFSLLEDDNTMKQQALAHHSALAEIVDILSVGENATDLLKVFARELEAHIRFEERQLFNHIQEQIDEATLTELGKQLALLDNNISEEWQDSFWAEKN